MEIPVGVVATVVVVPVAGFVGKQVWSFVKGKFDRYDKHLEDCNDKAVANAELKGQVTALDDKVAGINDHMIRIDGKLDQLLLRKS